MHLTTLLAPLLLSSLASILANPITPLDETNALSKRGLLGEKCGDSLSPPQPIEDWSVTCSTDDRSVVSLRQHTDRSYRPVWLTCVQAAMHPAQQHGDTC